MTIPRSYQKTSPFVCDHLAESLLIVDTSRYFRAVETTVREMAPAVQRFQDTLGFYSQAHMDAFQNRVDELVRSYAKPKVDYPRHTGRMYWEADPTGMIVLRWIDADGSLIKILRAHNNNPTDFVFLVEDMTNHAAIYGARK